MRPTRTQTRRGHFRIKSDECVKKVACAYLLRTDYGFVSRFLTKVWKPETRRSKPPISSRVERRREMLRPMTSAVSALSGIVANGHQAIHSVSSAPSKIPYGGCSPVRLQAGCQPRSSPPAGGFNAATVAISSVRVLFRSRACGPAALTASDTTHRPSGPWLRQRFCCPPASSLTMATSELLRRFAGFILYFRRTCRAAEGPHFYLPELVDVPPSLLRWLQ